MAAMRSEIARFTALQTEATSTFMTAQRTTIEDTKAVVMTAAAQSCAIIEENKAQVAKFAEAQAQATKSVADNLIAVITNFVKAETEKASENAALVTDSLTRTAGVVNKAADTAVASLTTADARAAEWTDAHIASLKDHCTTQQAAVDGGCTCGARIVWPFWLAFMGVT